MNLSTAQTPATTEVERAHPVAVVDLGSNSFHMLVAEVRNGELRIIDRLREMIRLASGLGRDNLIGEAATARAYACLERFGERIGDLPQGNVRIVGTNTLRKARNAQAFLIGAEARLRHPIDIISGVEEARLIYQGVARGLDDDASRRLVIDIGGGSTEFILGERERPELMESLHMGCVSMSERFFADGRITAEAFDSALLAARQELEAIEARFVAAGWTLSIGASGTILGVREVVRAQGWSTDGITRESLDALKAALVKLGRIDAIAFEGLSADRAPVFVGGVAVLLAAFDALGIAHMRVSDRALREGLLVDLMGRIGSHDIREQTVTRLVARHEVDVAQAARVEALVEDLARQTGTDWALEPDLARTLRWACRLHEMGLSVAHSQYHKHGAYLLSHMDMPGFGRRDQTRLAALVRYHRRKFPESAFAAFPEQAQTSLRRACVLLRVAVALSRRRGNTTLGPFTVRADGNTLKLRFGEGFLHGHPLTQADLAQEADYLKAAGIRLRCK